jgi:UPF0716 family protein affecting phage T7 exclusion
MRHDDEPARLGYDKTRPSWGVQSFVSKALAVVAATVLIVGAIALSIIAFAVIVAAALVIGVYFWWKTRNLRKQMRTASFSAPSDPNSNIIEGEVITRVVRDVEPHERD